MVVFLVKFCYKSSRPIYACSSLLNDLGDLNESSFFVESKNKGLSFQPFRSFTHKFGIMMKLPFESENFSDLGSKIMACANDCSLFFYVSHVDQPLLLNKI